ncbi:hypothetical protein [Curtobacterium sp. L1-20]|uniref:hypothetical protein n=1 Tax=Curtobacterium sp. L1-20 TaxID=3138181 RepID=UPI003B51B2D4
MWDFFLGPDRIDDIEYVQIGARSYDIDVVAGVVSLMRQDLEAQDEELRAEEALDLSRAASPLNQLPSRRHPIEIIVVPKALPGASTTAPKTVDLDEVQGLSRSERSRLRVLGAMGSVSFIRENAAPQIFSNRPQLRDTLEQYLRTEGRRRLNWTRLAAVLPALAGAALVPLWIVASAHQRGNAAAFTFGLILALGGLTIGLYASRRLAAMSVNRLKGHRFREVSREDFRSALTNVRAGILTTAGGTLLGVIATVLFYKWTGIDPV